MGEVWRAYDLKLRVDVALKTLRAELLEQERALQALRQEVRTAREVVSPNVCRVFDLVELDGQELVSMEYIDGTTLVRVLQSRGPLELQEAREIASQFLAGLEAIHQAGLVHRDLKPENIMITRSGRVVVMDFGIAKGLADRKTGTVSGTPAYMAPEQARGEEVNARADVFSAGVVLAEMIAPSGIQTHTVREAIWKGIHHEPPEISDSPWSSVLAKAVARLADQRYPSAAALARALEEVTLKVEGAEDVRPYPGLASFTEEDAEYFFGRELEVEAMWKKLRRPHLLGLIGPSGAGKSSFLRAGLLPVKPEGWRAVICQPGTSPFQSLARALVPEFSGDTEATQELLSIEKVNVALAIFKRWKQQHSEVLVIVDQFEELFTLNPPEVQSRFAELLGRMSLEADVRILLSMRDDFFIQCHEYSSLAPVFSESTPLYAPKGTALRRALVQPALKCGYRFENETLVDEMIAEVSEERGALPLLAFTAAQLWEHRDREKGLLTREAYEHIGGVGGSLAQHAEATLEKIGNDRVPIVREIFRNLVTAQGTRAARDMEELLSVFDDKNTANEVLGELIDARLLTSFELAAGEDEKASTSVEIIHESLLTAWPRLVRWQTQDADSAQLRDQLRQTAQLWQDRGRPLDLLWTGTSFNEFKVWRERYAGGLTSTEDAFAHAMVRQAERTRRRRRLAVTTFIALLLGGLTVITALWQRAVAETQRAEAGKLLALGQLEIERFPTLAVAYGLKSLEFSDTLEARRFTLEALQQGPTALYMAPPEGVETRGWAHAAEFSRNGKWLAIGGYQWAHIQPRSGETPFLVSQYPSTGFRVVQPRFSPGGEHLVTAKLHEARFLSVPDFKELVRVKDLEGPTWFVATDAGFSSMTMAGNEIVLSRWSFDGSESQVVGRMEARFGRDWDIDRKGHRLVYGNGHRIFFRPLNDWEQRPTLIAEHPADVMGVAFRADAMQLAASDASGEIRLWSLESECKDPVRILDGGSLPWLVFDNSGDRLAAYGNSNGQPTVRLWNLTTSIDAAPTILRFGAMASGSQAGFLNGAAFDPSGQWLVTAHAWDVALWPVGGRLPVTLTGHEGRIDSVVFTPDGKHLVSAGGGDDTVRIWSLESGVSSRILLEENMQFPRLVVDPTGKFVVVPALNSVFVVPLEGGTPRKLEGFSSAATNLQVDLDPTGRFVAATSPFGPEEEQKVIRIWDLELGESWILGPLDNAGGHKPTFIADSRLLVGEASGLQLWDLKNGYVKTLSQPAAWTVASRDGRFALGTHRQNEHSVQVVWFDLEMKFPKC
jgi:WD40 repeat protein